MDFDVITIGAGHNSLITSAYLAKAGYRVGVFERRHVVGGAVATEEIVPGYQFDIGGSAHILIRLTPVIDELDLQQFGLQYLELDPLFTAPRLDGTCLRIYRNADRTSEHLENLSPGAGEAYNRFLNDWSGFARTMRDMFLSSPSPLQLGRKMIFGESTSLPWQDALRMIMRPYGDVVDEYFSYEPLKAALTWMAAQSGPPPTEPMTGPFVLWHPLYHEGGVARPRGGSGMLTQSLKKCVEYHGGQVFTDEPVENILVDRGRAVGIIVNNSVYTARSLVNGTHAHTLFSSLLPEEHVPNHTRKLRTGNGFGAMLRLALDEPVSYNCDSPDEARIGLQLLCRSTQQIKTAYGEYLGKKPSSDPPLVAMTFSAVDDSLAPAGSEVLWLWGQYFPYDLAEQNWDAIANAVQNSLIDNFNQYANDIRPHIVGELFQHPEWLERELDLHRGNVMHLEMSIDQMFSLRPAAGLSEYRSHLKALYLTGASTHPGGGIMGASGRNTARVLLKDLETKRI